ncbi:hypothetical protein J5N97_028150 [Dioscorea zingiberensis]|uniref:Bifunctional inhibitor/plant lipid transfer protein/seed storage helical domain-containing protein n=1 Tax=Dioscorea zingiberensis TaxID=325984 RepID=A0A9D5BYE6_9LILI|nr:hypothetical protein J5N97_028150 [Dioscorea zingiberensis]
MGYQKQYNLFFFAAEIGFVLLLLAAVVVTVKGETHTECGVAQTAFGMCVPYVMGQDPHLSAQCCQGVQSVRSLATTPQSHKAICQCLRLLMLSLGNIDSARAAALSSQCGASTSVIPTTLSFDCTKLA